MSADELIFKLKLEKDAESFAEAEKALTELEKRARAAGKAGGGGGKGGKEDAEAESSTLKELRKQLAQYREELAKVNALSRESGGITDSLRETQVNLGASIRDTVAQIQEANRGYGDQKTILESTANTYYQLEEQNRALSIAMKSVPLDDTTGRLEQLQEQYAQNNVKLKEFDASMGNFQRSVGDYTGGLRRFASSLAVIQGPLGPIAGRMNALATTIDKFRNKTSGATESTSALGRVLTGTIPLLKAKENATKASATATLVANGAIKGLNVSLRLLRVALVGLGIPALALAIASVVQAFRRTEEGAQRLRVVMAGFSAIFDVILDRLSTFGEALIRTVTTVGRVIKDFVFPIFENLGRRIYGLYKATTSAFSGIINSATAVGLAIKGIWSAEAREESKKLFKEAKSDLINFGLALEQFSTGAKRIFGDVSESSEGMFAEIRREMALREALERRMNAVLVNERNIALERALQNKELQKARELARDLDQDAQERLTALRQIATAEAQTLEKELANERERLRIMEEQVAISKTDERTKRDVVDQQIKLANLERESSERRMSLQRDINTVERQIREENLRRERTRFEIEQRNRELGFAQTRDKLIEEGRLTEALQSDLTRVIAESEAERAKLKGVFLAEFLNQKFSAEEADRLATEKADIEMRETIYKSQKALDDQLRQERIDVDKFDRDIALQRQQMLLTFERDRLIRQGRLVEAAQLEQLHTEAGQQQLLNELKTRYLQEFLDQGLTAEEASRRAKEKAEIESEQRIFDAKRALMDAELEQRINNANLASNAIGAINNAFFANSKELAVAKAIIDTYAGANSAFAQTNASIEGKLIAAGIAIANGFANVRKILNTKVGDKSVSKTATSGSRVGSSFGLVDVGTNRRSFAFDTATMAQSSSSQQFNPKIVLAGEFDPAFLAVKVTMGNNQISSQGTGF